MTSAIVSGLEMRFDSQPDEVQMVCRPDCREEVERLDRDVLVIDIAMPVLNGLQAVSELQSRKCRTPSNLATDLVPGQHEIPRQSSRPRCGWKGQPHFEHRSWKGVLTLPATVSKIKNGWLYAACRAWIITKRQTPGPEVR